MKKNNYFLVVAGLVAAAVPLFATTVIPPTFEQLVDQAQVIFHGNVTKIDSEWIGEGAQRHIVSYVTFHVKDALKGTPGENYTMRMYGGTVDGETMEIGDGPKFEVGDEDILFVENNGSQVVPLVGIMYGRFHVRRDESGKEVVTTNEDEPLRSVSGLGREGATLSSSQPVMTPAGFKAAIRSRLQNGSTQQ